jgi:uncharacterized protein
MDIRHNEKQSQYETTVDGHTGYAAYDLEDPDRIVFTHTIVPPEFEGRGLASAIVKYALEDVRAKNLKVVPQCAYVAAFIQRHPEYQDLLAQ